VVWEDGGGNPASYPMSSPASRFVAGSLFRCVRFGYPRSGKIVAPAIGYFASMSASEIHEIRPGCLMLPPLHFPVRVWRADGSREAAVWTGKEWWAGGAIEPVRWQEMFFRRLDLASEAQK
jgi:hypothetical protein